jgi:hypothetical protein
MLQKAGIMKFTTLWRREIGLKNWKTVITTTNASRLDVIEAAKRIYKGYPEILKHIPSK